ncbi:MAG: OmpH family outer membrane protein [Flavobacteriaceae bacterium]|nr:OmpH family outer membrane protein [Flavobacteriaceae bacterium]
MKLFKNLFIIGALFLGMAAVQAQSKVAHINTEELVSAMPETKKMQEDLKKLAQEYDTEYKNQATELEAKLKKYDAEAATQTDAENQKRYAEVQELQRKIQLYAQSAQQELQKKEFDLYKPIAEKAQKAINDVAAEKAIQYVFDSSPGKGLIVYTGDDLMGAVKAKLGIK